MPAGKFTRPEKINQEFATLVEIELIFVAPNEFVLANSQDGSFICSSPYIIPIQ